jgi:transcriptional regulator with XRE-family HTH domain
MSEEQQPRKLSDIRKESGYSPTDLAYKAGVSVGTLSRMEAGKRVSLLMVAKVLKALNVDLSEVKGLNIIPEREGE